MSTAMDRQMNQLLSTLRQSYIQRYEHTAQEIYPARAVYSNLQPHYEPVPVYPSKPIYKWMKLNLADFPPAHHCSEYQLRELCSMMRSLFEEYNYLPVIPFSLTYTEEYQWFLRALRHTDINTLSYDPDEAPVPIFLCEESSHNCPFGRHCPGEKCDHHIKHSPDRNKYIEEI